MTKKVASSVFVDSCVERVFQHDAALFRLPPRGFLSPPERDFAEIADCHVNRREEIDVECGLRF